MKVRELIEELQRQDPEAEAMAWHGAVEDWMPVEEVGTFEYPPYPFAAAVRLSP